MKFIDLLKQAKEIEKQNGYKRLKGEEYGMTNCNLLFIQGAKPGIYAPVSAIVKSKLFDFRGAKTYMVAKPVINQNDAGESEMRGRAGYGRVINIEEIKLKDGKVIEQSEVIEMLS